MKRETRLAIALVPLIAFAGIAVCVASRQLWSTLESSGDDAPPRIEESDQYGRSGFPEGGKSVIVLPEIPTDWISEPEVFASEDDESRYRAGEWHLDGDLRGRYGFREVSTPDGLTYVAGEVVVKYPLGTGEEAIASDALMLNAVDYSISDNKTLDCRFATLVFPGNTDCVELSNSATRLLSGNEASPNYSGSVDV